VQAGNTLSRRTLGAVAWQSLGSFGTRTDRPWIAEPELIGP